MTEQFWAELEALLAQYTTDHVAEWQHRIVEIMERFNRQMLIIEVIQCAALTLAVFALCYILARAIFQKKRGKHWK